MNYLVEVFLARRIIFMTGNIVGGTLHNIMTKWPHWKLHSNHLATPYNAYMATKNSTNQKMYLSERHNIEKMKQKPDRGPHCSETISQMPSNHLATIWQLKFHVLQNTLIIIHWILKYLPTDIYFTVIFSTFEVTLIPHCHLDPLWQFAWGHYWSGQGSMYKPVEKSKFLWPIFEESRSPQPNLLV